jgi:hypothetical protein
MSEDERRARLSAICLALPEATRELTATDSYLRVAPKRLGAQVK